MRFIISFTYKIPTHRVICENHNFWKHRIRSELIEGKNYSYQLLFSGCVIFFSIIQGLARIVDGMKVFILSLAQYCPNCEITRITH